MVNVYYLFFTEKERESRPSQSWISDKSYISGWYTRKYSYYSL